MSVVEDQRDGGPDPTDAAPAAPHHDRFVDRAYLAVVSAVAAVPVLAAAVRAGSSWMALQDTAGMVMRSRDVFSTSTPLLGMPTSLSVTLGRPVHHPGPIGFWPSAVAQAIVDHSAAPMVATVLVNLACIVGVVVIAHRIGGRVAAGGAAVLVALSCWSLRGEVLFDPLNPNAGHLPLALYLVAAVGVASGRAGALPALVLAGSFAAQSHVSLLAPIGAVGVALIGWGAWVAIRERGSWRSAATWVPTVVRHHRRPIAVGLAVAVVAWLPVLVDLVFRSHNLWYLARAGGGTGEESLGWGASWDILTRAITSPGWLEGARSSIEVVAPVETGAHVVASALLLFAVVVIVVLARRGHTAVPAALALSLAALLGGGFGLTLVPMNFWNRYSFANYLWLWPVTAVFWVGLVAGVAVLVRPLVHARTAVIGRWAPVAALVVCAAVAVAAFSPSTRVNFWERFGAPAREVVDQLAAELDPDQAYVVEIPEGIEREFVPMGTALELERRGFDIVVAPPHLAGMVGSHRTTSDRPVAARLIFDQGLVLEGPPPGAIEVARFTPSAEDRGELESIEREMMALITERGTLVLATDPLRQYDVDAAASVVESGELLGLWEFGVLIDPNLPDELMERYRSAFALPVRPVVVYAEPPSAIATTERGQAGP